MSLPIGARVVDELLRDLVTFMDGRPSLPVLVAIVVAITPVLVLVHELGHALAALLLLHGPVHVAVGATGPLASFRLGRMTLELRPLVIPWRFEGACAYDGPVTRARAVAIALAGPALSLASGVVLAQAFSASSPGLWQDVLGTAALGSFVGAVVCLVPLTLVDADGVAMRTDGAVALDALRS